MYSLKGSCFLGNLSYLLIVNRQRNIFSYSSLLLVSDLGLKARSHVLLANTLPNRPRGLLLVLVLTTYIDFLFFLYIFFHLSCTGNDFISCQLFPHEFKYQNCTFSYLFFVIRATRKYKTNLF